MGTKRVIVVTALTVLLTPVMMAAHHSFAAMYDANKPVTLSGTLTRMMWSNPHGKVYVDVKGRDGKVSNWEIEIGSPGQLIRRGWKRSDLPVGTEVIFKGYLARSGKPVVNGTSITLVRTGRELFAADETEERPGAPPAR
jgi:hypothetical protein